MKLFPPLKEISITEIDGLRIGNAQNLDAMTGVTVLRFDEGAKVGCDISGGGPASRETPLASPVTADNPINAIVLSGGSAFGLAASDGVMRYLESCIYDLGIGRADVRPDAAMGYAACENAERNQPESGIIGAGTGASVGKICGREYAAKTGLGIYAVSAGKLKIAAVVVLNALGDIYDPSTGQKIAGPKLPGIDGFADSREELYKLSQKTDLFEAKNSNTTIGAIITNGDFSKAELNKIASMTRSAYSRCINPVGTMADGDSIYAASCGLKVPADVNMAGTLAAEVMAEAIQVAVNAVKK